MKAKIKFVVGASRSLVILTLFRVGTVEKIWLRLKHLYFRHHTPIYLSTSRLYR